MTSCSHLQSKQRQREKSKQCCNFNLLYNVNIGFKGAVIMSEICLCFDCQGDFHIFLFCGTRLIFCKSFPLTSADFFDRVPNPLPARLAPGSPSQNKQHDVFFFYPNRQSTCLSARSASLQTWVWRHLRPPKSCAGGETCQTVDFVRHVWGNYAATGSHDAPVFCLQKKPDQVGKDQENYSDLGRDILFWQS